MKTESLNNLMPDEKGFFGCYGGAEIPQNLEAEFKKIEKTFLELKNNNEIFSKVLKDNFLVELILYKISETSLYTSPNKELGSSNFTSSLFGWTLTSTLSRGIVKWRTKNGKLPFIMKFS